IGKLGHGADLDEKFENVVVNGSKHQVGTWPFPSRVLEIRRMLPNTDVADRIAAAIATPKGHKNVYEIDTLMRRAEVAPANPVTLPLAAQKRGAFDNHSVCTFEAKFSSGNNTGDTALPPFDLRYRTNGYMTIAAEHDSNRWSEQERGDWRAHGRL